MGDQFTRESGRAIGFNGKHDSEELYRNHGMVRSVSDESMAVLAKSMVDFPHGQTNASKEKFSLVENDVPPLSSINLMRIGSDG